MRIGIGGMGLAVLLATATAADTPAGRNADVAAILDRMAEAYGGREALRSFAGFRARGKVLSLSDGVNGTLRLDVALAGDLRSEISYPHRTETRILSGALAWSGGVNRQQPSEPEMTASMRLQFHRLVAPFELAATEAAELTSEGWSEEGYARLRRDWSGDIHTIYEIDPATGQIRRTRGEVGHGDDAIRFETESNDFRDVDGVLFPFRMSTTVSGHTAAETILDRVERESHFDPQHFLPVGSAGDM